MAPAPSRCGTPVSPVVTEPSIAASSRRASGGCATRGDLEKFPVGRGRGSRGALLLQPLPCRLPEPVSGGNLVPSHKHRGGFATLWSKYVTGEKPLFSSCFSALDQGQRIWNHIPNKSTLPLVLGVCCRCRFPGPWRILALPSRASPSDLSCLAAELSPSYSPDWCPPKY